MVFDLPSPSLLLLCLLLLRFADGLLVRFAWWFLAWFDCTSASAIISALRFLVAVAVAVCVIVVAAAAVAVLYFLFSFSAFLMLFLLFFFLPESEKERQRDGKVCRTLAASAGFLVAQHRQSA